MGDIIHGIFSVIIGLFIALITSYIVMDIVQLVLSFIFGSCDSAGCFAFIIMMYPYVASVLLFWFIFTKLLLNIQKLSQNFDKWVREFIVILSISVIGFSFTFFLVQVF
jgi:hypothetical protein